ncbi:MAG TPA: hypothetical protein VHR97_07060 [Candidatus Baltobacteraceae bacterium]|jgi:hypothetical protein|nr:hypothetical protein [Candidatus Baltobacteraceae bacterium]
MIENERWQRFLEPLVGNDRPVSVAQLDGALQNLTDRAGDARGEIYAYLSARQRVGAKRAFWIGEALRECSIQWSSGVVALAAAGHLQELVALMALLTLRTRGEEECAALLAACCAVLTCADPRNAELTALQEETRGRLVANNIGALPGVCEAWKALEKRAGSHGRLFASVRSSLRDAYASARLEDHRFREARVFEDLGRWAISVAGDNGRFLAYVQSRFAARAEVEQRRTHSVYLDALYEFGRSHIDVAQAPFDVILRETGRSLEEIAREDYGIELSSDVQKTISERKTEKGKKEK